MEIVEARAWLSDHLYPLYPNEAIQVLYQPVIEEISTVWDGEKTVAEPEFREVFGGYEFRRTCQVCGHQDRILARPKDIEEMGIKRAAVTARYECSQQYRLHMWGAHHRDVSSEVLTNADLMAATDLEVCPYCFQALEDDMAHIACITAATIDEVRQGRTRDTVMARLKAMNAEMANVTSDVDMTAAWESTFPPTRFSIDSPDLEITPDGKLIYRGGKPPG